LRPLSYPMTDCFLLCFDVSKEDSLSNVRYKWKKEVEHYAPGIPMLLVGLKVDLRDEKEGKARISYEMGVSAAVEIGAARYVECSAKTANGVQESFDWAIRCAEKIDVTKKKPKKCTLL